MSANPPASSSRYALGIDIGGTKLAVGVATPDGQLLLTDRIPTLAHEGPDAVINRLIDLCKKTVAKSQIPWDQFVVGVACVGPLDADRGLIQNPANLPGWHDIPLIARLQEAFHAPTFLENDANAAALGEFLFGAGRGTRNMVYLTISTGIGGGAILDGKLYRGENGNAAEIGHTTVLYNGRLCNCGNLGCLEAYCSGTHIAARAREAIQAGASSLILQLAGSPDKITTRHILEALKQSDSFAQSFWAETMSILGAGLCNVIHNFNPRRIVLGGGVTHAGDLLFIPVRRETYRRAMKPLADVCDIVPATLGDDVGIYGALAVALQRV
jgi:glucokinase